MKPRELNQKLADDVLSVCQKLLPAGKVNNQSYEVGSINGEEGQSMKIPLLGKHLGGFNDFASGEKGDLITLWSLVKKIDFTDALGEIKEYLGVKEPDDFHTFAPKKKFVPPVKPPCEKIKPESLVGAWLTQTRMLSQKTIDAYKIGIKGEKIIFPLLDGKGELIMYKTRDMRKEWDNPESKKAIACNKDPQYCLFGWQAIREDARQVVIVEGEIDAMTCYEQNIPALSVPFGGGSGNKQHAWIDYEFHNLERFDQIYLMLDQDEEGQLATKEILERLGRHNCWIVELPEKDANKCHQKGIDLMPFIQKAKTVDPDELKNSAEFRDDVWKEFYSTEKNMSGMALPWFHTRENIRFRSSETTVWTGYNGHGKSQVLGHIFTEAVSQDFRVCIASMEMKPSRLLKRMFRQAGGVERPEQNHFEKINSWLASGLWIFNVKGTAKTKRILEVFKYARQRYGVTHFLVDSLAKCGVGEDDYAAQKNFVEQLTDFAAENDCHAHLVVHSRKQNNESGMPGKMDVKGTGAITDMVDNVITIWRNKDKEEKIEKAKTENCHPGDDIKAGADAILHCSKQRHEDWEGKIRLWFDRPSYQFKEDQNGKIWTYVKDQVALNVNEKSFAAS
jgi:twinkle protein